MSFNQSKGEKSESQYRKPGRSVNSGNNPRASSGAAGGKGGGGNAPPPQPSLATNRSFNKKPGSGGGQSRVGVPNSNSQFNTSATRPSQNGGHFQSPASGFSEAPAPVGAVKPTNPPAPRSTRPVPKAPSSQTVPGGFDSVAPSTPSKADAPKSFQLQFGSISPGVVNGMQIPARTSSAPPNLDEQKRDQAQHESFRAPPTIPPPSASKQQLPLKDSGANKPLATEELHAASSHAKRDVHPQVPSAAGTTVTQKPSVHPIPGISMPMPFQSQVPIPFGGPNSQIQSQGVPTTSLQMPMPLSVGSGAHVQQQVFVQGLQSHSIQPQGMMPQGQNLSFTTQIGHQMPPQMANMGIGISPQYSQQPGKLVSHRKAVKITHPDTHEELRLDRRTDSYKDSGSSGVRSHPNVPTQTQPMPPFTPHQISYYPPMQPGSYNHSMYFPTTQTAVPLTSTQMSAGPQGPRYTYPGGQAPTTITFKNPSTLNPLPGGKNSEHPHDSQVATGSVSLPSVQVTVRPVVVSMGEGVGTSSVIVSSPVVSKGESPKLLRVPKDANTILPQREGDIDSGNSKQQSKTVNEPVAPPPSSVNGKHSSTASATVSTQRLSTSTSSSAASPSEESASITTNTEGKQKETVRRTDSFKDRQKKTGKKDAKNTELLNQEDVSNHAGSVKLSSPRMSRDVTRGSDSMQSPPSDMVELTPSNLSSQDLTHISSLKNGNSVEGLSSVGGSLVSSEEALPDASVSVDSIHHQGIVNSCSILLSEAQAQAQTQAPTVEAENDIITAKEDGQIKGVPDDWEDAAELSKEADAAGSTSDLYMAYKGPEEKQENVVPGESIESSCSILLREAQAQTPTRKLNTFVGKQGRAGSAGNNEDGNISKKYSRDFFLTLLEQCTDRPTRFEIGSDIAESLMSVQVAISPHINKWWALSDRSPTLATKPSTHVGQMLTYARRIKHN